MSDSPAMSRADKLSSPPTDTHDEPEPGSNVNRGPNSKSTLTTSSFETDLSSPLRKRFEDRTSGNDPKYQKYVQLVERNLQSFDYVSEWADVTAFLTKLSKSLEIYAKFPLVPHKETVAKRLAQCLNPALPTGVHQKALSIYEQIFRQIGADQLTQDLSLYAYGLFPFMRNASLKAKPQLLDIFSEFIIPLGSSLRPCMKSLAVGVLPGLEEGSMDVFNRVMQLLDKLRDTVDPAFFYQTMFLIMITTSEQRESALKYLAQRLPVFAAKEDLPPICGEDPSLMTRALASTLTDSKTLVLRAALDLVMTRFPLRTNVLETSDLVLLMKHAAEVVLKKDMSLNRRLYTWLLGPSESDAEQAAYFAQHSLAHLREAILGSFAAMSSDPENQHTVLRVLIGLIDKPVISQPVLDHVFVPLLQLLILERNARPEHTLPVKLASVSRMLVEMLDPIFTWSSIINQLSDSIDESAQSLDVGRVARALQLVLFFVQTFELDDEATLQIHLPMTMLNVLATLEHVLRNRLVAKPSHLSCCFTRLAIEIFTRIPKSMYATDGYDETEDGVQKSITDTLDVEALFGMTREFYSVHRPSQTSTGRSAAQVEQLAAKVVRGPGLLYATIRLCKNISAFLGTHVIHVAAEKESTAKDATVGERLASLALEDTCHILQTASAYSQDLMQMPRLSQCTLPLPQDPTISIEEWQQGSQTIHSDLWVPVFISVICSTREFSILAMALETLLQFIERGLLPRSVLLERGSLDRFVQRLWGSLAPDRTTFHFQATQLLYKLRSRVDARAVERQLAAKLSNPGSGCGVRELSHYAIFWHNMRLIQREAQSSSGESYDPLAFSRLLLLVLDGTAQTSSSNSSEESGYHSGQTSCSALSQSTASQAWIDSSVDDWEYIMETLLTLLLLSIRTHKRRYTAVLAVGYASECQEYTADFDYAQISYYLDTIQRYVLCADGSVIRSMLRTSPRSKAIVDACTSFSGAEDSWLQVVASASIEFALTDVPPQSNHSFSAVESMRAKAAELAVNILSCGGVAWPTKYISRLQSRVVDTLLFCVLHHRITIQPPLLELFGSLVRASVGISGELLTTVSDEGRSTRAAGIGAISDLTLFSRLVLAAITMQMSMVALSRWVKTIELCLPHIQEHISTSPLSATEDQDLMRILVLPCLHSLRLLLSQCAEYFARSNDLQMISHRNATRKQLRKRLLPLFAIPAETFEAENDVGMSVDVLGVLLDAFDLFLTLSLRNADRLVLAEAASVAAERPSSRASQMSGQSAVSSGSMGPIPILRFVSGIFGQEESSSADTGSAADTLANNDMPGISIDEEHVTRREDVEKSDSAEFSLVTVLSVMRELWNAFDPTQPRQTDDETVALDIQLLREFGVADLHIGEHSGDHMKRTIHSHITRILDHAVGAQPAEITEAMAELWARDNPQWITRLDSNVRYDATRRKSRRRQSSASSMHSAMSPASAPRELPTSGTTALTADESDTETVSWNWQAADLLECVPGRSPIAILTTLLNDLHIRSIDPAASTAQSSGSASIAGSSESNVRTSMRFSSLDDIALIRFIELFARHRLTARTSSPLVPHIMSLLRDYNANAQQHKLVLPFLLRMFTELCERVASGSQNQDPAQRVYSHELCTSYAKLVDNCILIAGRSFDQTTWLRRGNSDVGSGGLVVRADAFSERVLSEDDLIDQVLSYTSGCVIPQFAHLVPDYERQVTIATNLMHYAVMPAFKSHMTGGYSGPAQALTSRSQHFALILRCLGALSQQASLMKVWKREVWEFFCDAKFFPSSVSTDHTTMTPMLAPLWRHLVRTLLMSEKERFAEVLGKISSASSGPALFANRDYEAQMRAISIRRLSFVVWAGATNQYLSSLPQIQERLVDILKNAPHPAVQMEVFLCLRVLLCRMSSHHMSNFWPMLLTELMRLFRQQLAREGREDPEQANLFLSACKFLDLLFILGTDDFLVHQWIFITDTIDALYGSRSVSHALLDQLSSRLLSMPSRNTTRRSTRSGSQQTQGTSALPNPDTYPRLLVSDNDDPTNLVYQQISPGATELVKSGQLGLNSNSTANLQNLCARPFKRPIIRVRSVTSIRELDAFVHNASVQTYQAAYTMAEPDIEFIEALLVSDMMYFDFAGVSATLGAIQPASS
ncbi:hypothetical protein GGI07_003993, partial [Coemansia sp. Benny D115]